MSFFDNARELVEENDRRLILELEAFEPEGDAGGNSSCREADAHTIELVHCLMIYRARRWHHYFNRQDRLFRGYKELIRYVPLAKTIIDGSGELAAEDLSTFYKNVRGFFMYKVSFDHVKSSDRKGFWYGS